MTSRLDLARDAVRPALKARAMISGPPGAGKTRTGLIIATELAGRDYLDDGTTRAILVIDTERESALTYADDFVFRHLPWRAPYDPRDLADTVIDAGQVHDVVMVDSGSHFWRGRGGTLDIADGQFTGWKDARPAQNDLVDAILACEAHVIICVRAKMAHEQVNENGKWKVNKLGVQPIQDDDLEYELNVSLDQAMDHSLTVSKSRTTHVPVGTTYTAGHAAEFATVYREWLAGGEPTAPPEVIEDLRLRVAALPKGLKGDCKAEYLATLGRPGNLTESLIPMAEALVARYETQAAGAQNAQDGSDPAPSPDAPAGPSEDGQEPTSGASAATDDDEPEPGDPWAGIVPADGLTASDIRGAVLDTLRTLYHRPMTALGAEAREARLSLSGNQHQLARRIAQHRLAAVGINVTQGALQEIAHAEGIGQADAS